MLFRKPNLAIMKDQLALRIKIGDEKAFELLFRKYYIRLCAFANKFLNEPEEAREVVQELFTKVWEGRKEINPEESLNAYLFKITQNICFNRLRRKKVESNYIEIYKLVYVDHFEISPFDSLLANELNDNISRAVDKIPFRCRRVFELSRMEGLKYSEIASALKISVKTVEAQMSKALRILRFELTDYMKILIIPLMGINILS
jgi:RNA polymerase sigma-70 factor, ECF subfamily